MRLIDADKLLEPGYTDMFDEPIRFAMVSRYAIESAPTVKAIPIEFIEEYIEYQDTEEKKVLRMMWHAWELWEKEHEAN